jgi:hypothetical protein
VSRLWVLLADNSLALQATYPVAFTIGRRGQIRFGEDTERNNSAIRQSIRVSSHRMPLSDMPDALSRTQWACTRVRCHRHTRRTVSPKFTFISTLLSYVAHPCGNSWSASSCWENVRLVDRVFTMPMLTIQRDLTPEQAAARLQAVRKAHYTETATRNGSNGSV